MRLRPISAAAAVLSAAVAPMTAEAFRRGAPASVAVSARAGRLCRRLAASRSSLLVSPPMVFGSSLTWKCGLLLDFRRALTFTHAPHLTDPDTAPPREPLKRAMPVGRVVSAESARAIDGVRKSFRRGM